MSTFASQVYAPPSMSAASHPEAGTAALEAESVLSDLDQTECGGTPLATADTRPGERILVAMGDASELALVAEALRTAGHDVAAALDGELATALAYAVPFDLIVLDEAYRTVAVDLKRRPTLPVLLVTTGTSLGSEGLMDGSVDDFIRRPVDATELQSRVRVLLHSGSGRRRPERGDLEGPHGVIVRPQTREIILGDDQIHLRPLECSVLRLLLERRGEVVTIDTLLDEVWQPGPNSSRNLVEAQISRLRAKLRGTEAEDLITTVHGVGYLIR